MVIDIHTFPGFFEEICEDPKKIEFRREQYFLYTFCISSTCGP